MLNVSVIGIGRWGYNHLRTFSMLADAHVATACDRSEELLAKARNEFGSLKTTTSADDAIDAAEAVVISSTAKTHYELAKKALEADRHVLVEKPLALKVAEGRDLVELAAKKKRILMVGHLLLHHPAVILLKQMIDAGDIGKPLYLYSQRVNLGMIRKDENVIWSLAPHDISMANHIFGGLPEKVSAKGQAYLQSGVEDVGFLNLEFADRQLAHTQVSWLDPHKVRRLTVVGDEKMAVFDDMETEEKLKIYDKGAEPTGNAALFGVRYGDIRSPRVEMKEPLRLVAEHFVDCVRNGKTPRTDGRQGLDVLRILEATDRSLKQGGVPVELAP